MAEAGRFRPFAMIFILYDATLKGSMTWTKPGRGQRWEEGLLVETAVEKYA